MRSQMSINVPEPGILSMQYTKQEFPTYGTGDYRSPALTIVQENGSRIVNFTYASHEIYNGKKDILPLPATYVENEDGAMLDSVDRVQKDDVIRIFVADGRLEARVTAKEKNPALKGEE